MSTLYRFFHKLWRLVPRSVRRFVFFAGTSLIAPRASRSVSLRPGPATVAGLFNSTTGMGEGARLCLSGLRSLGFDTRHFDLSAAFRQRDLPGSNLIGQPAQPGESGWLIVHINAPDLPFALVAMGRRLVRHKRVIGYWVWELRRIPPNWGRGFHHVHEIWVPSQFAADAIRPHTNLPVRVVPHPVSNPVGSSLGRADFGFPQRAFVALTMFHMSSSFVRKNPIASVRAFRKAFAEDPNTLLVVQAPDGMEVPWALRELESEIGDAPNIRLMHDKLSREGVAALIGCADVVMSLHRSEGFGLVPAQAMLLGKPVVATGWSGNMDFMAERNSALVSYKLIPARDPQGTYSQTDQFWADPDVEHAAHWLQRLASSPDLRRKLGEAAAQDAARLFGLSSYKEAVGASLISSTST